MCACVHLHVFYCIAFLLVGWFSAQLQQRFGVEAEDKDRQHVKHDNFVSTKNMSFFFFILEVVLLL